MARQGTGKGSKDRSQESIRTARRVLTIESEAVAALRDRVDATFSKAIDLIEGCKGKVVVTGIGKSGLICQKIASTFASTGCPAFFLHPAEGVHGDLGAMTRNDVVLAVSNSGETEEIINQRLGGFLNA